MMSNAVRADSRLSESTRAAPWTEAYIVVVEGSVSSMCNRLPMAIED